MTKYDDRVAEVLMSESERIRALLERDYSSLRAMLDESLVHVHATGRLENYASYLAGVSNNLEFLTITRGSLEVRLFAGTAIMTGPIDQHLRIKATGAEMELAAIATQVWVESDGRWKLASFHACRRD